MRQPTLIEVPLVSRTMRLIRLGGTTSTGWFLRLREVAGVVMLPAGDEARGAACLVFRLGVAAVSMCALDCDFFCV